MSILLESLQQSSDKQGNDIPGVGDSHFDDEMLSDEWLLARLRRWKIVCALLLLALVITSIGWYQSSNQSNSELSIIKTPPIAEQANDSNSQMAQSAENKQQAVQVEDKNDFGALEIKSSVEQPSNTQPVKQKYVPKKVAQPTDSNPTLNASSAEKTLAQDSALAKANSKARQSKTTRAASTGTVIDYESLSSQQQDEMPELEISSYAVSSNSKKSFVVLNGAFYGQGETIAPNLVLVSIEKESIVVRYFDQLIRKKYGL
jgi:FtsZ-interacting cell division protein ZipA